MVNKKFENEESIPHSPLTGGISGMLFLFSAKNRTELSLILPTLLPTRKKSTALAG